MVSLYKHHAPSTTSLSDDADDIDEETPQFAFYPEHQLAPAQWVNKRDHQAQYTLRPAYHSPISTIPPEILIQVLRHVHSPRDLFAAMRVSRSFCECAVELLWHKPTFPKYNTIHKMANLLQSENQTFTYSRFIRRLNFLSHGQDLSDELFSVFARCDRLERLTLIGCKNLSAQALTEILPAFSSLVAIDLSNVSSTSSNALIGLASVATRLQGINLSGCDKVTDDGVLALARNCPLLRRVKLSGLTHLTDESISALAEGCPMLLEIDLNHCHRITDISVRLIWTYLIYMREMRLSHCSLLTDAAFPAPFGGTEYMEGVNPFVSSTRTEADDLPPLLINRIFENLRMLDLTACPLITDTAVEGLISHAPKIRNLVLSKCVLLTDRSVESICRLGRHLHYLHLGHASRVTDRSVRILARQCTRIRYIDFANCVLLTDMSVFELSALPKLRRIGLVRVNQLTDEAIYALAERHATLERIHLSYCDQISVMAIHFLLLKLHKLTHLSLTGVPAFRQPELQRFCREAPKDFNTAQRLAFCVFSGKGVSQLRAYLTELFDSITEMNNTDDTEYEDDFDGEGYQEDETPEPEIAGDVQMEGMPRSAPSPDNATMTHAHTGPSHTPSHQPVIAPGAASAQYFAGVPNQNQPPRPQMVEVTSRFGGPPIYTTPTAGPSRYTATGAPNRYHRSVADSLPIVESSATPSPITTPGYASGAASDNGSGFFRTYQERPSAAVPPRGNGAMTPDLNYAEIGHGRGANTSQSSQGASTVRGHVMNRTPRQQPMARPLPTIDPRPVPIDSDSDEILDGNLQRGNLRSGVASVPTSSSSHHWTHHEPTRSAPPGLELNDSSMLVDGESSSRGRQEQQRHRHERGDPSTGRSRSVRRQIKNTIHAAEHYASSLFHRSTGHVNEVGDAAPVAGPIGSSTNHIGARSR
ncbi:hypothetical protein CPB83DRAFT_754576 [Crepidotus variabilis]|uniref:F-box domain-containing protein n=1 Tax=Crepidotus variabilis TaxID=179855 RepID=A0A9P6ERF3_9AGAR|nr:hypothetical protein CPB83DRAFT_754576 [Crepidotus variabilis]